jgi:hypothetical protein
MIVIADGMLSGLLPLRSLSRRAPRSCADSA